MQKSILCIKQLKGVSVLLIIIFILMISCSNTQEQWALHRLQENDAHCSMWMSDVLERQIDVSRLKRAPCVL